MTALGWFIFASFLLWCGVVFYAGFLLGRIKGQEETLYFAGTIAHGMSELEND